MSRLLSALDRHFQDTNPSCDHTEGLDEDVERKLLMANEKLLEADEKLLTANEKLLAANTKLQAEVAELREAIKTLRLDLGETAEDVSEIKPIYRVAS